ncbi:hypothetical protein [Acidianus ambivalens]|uniref:Uncharacterized protein n=1 Tax=Acidianus ambivalens TaxID=2283 RepID=A0A650CU96_ACIAM|nr:hypothetical protein [Acidianus ambivalens]MQL56241.1 hypothetical protein [Acidianus ambivalens]QGR21222.1 hypothetical protein D1866_03790 [Acidianus ambivalens]
MQEIKCKSKEEFLDYVKKAKIIIAYADMSLPIWKYFVCSIGDLHLRLITYNNKSVIEVLAVDTFKQYWTKVPDRKYYFVMKSPDGYGAIAPAKSDEEAERFLEGWVYGKK